MPNEKKVQLVSSIVEILEKHPNFIVFNFGSLPHQRLEEVRNKVRKIVPKLKVVKNSLLQVALQKVKKGKAGEGTILKGQSAVLALSDDWSEGLGVFYKEIKDEEGVGLKVGVLDDKLYEKDELIRIALLPTKSELVGKIISSLKSPQTRLVYGMKYNISKFTYVLRGMREN